MCEVTFAFSSYNLLQMVIDSAHLVLARNCVMLLVDLLFFYVSQLIIIIIFHGLPPLSIEQISQCFLYCIILYRLLSHCYPEILKRC